MRATRRFGIHDVPPVVMVQLKRFVFTLASLYGPSKVGNHIGFGPTLRLDPFLSAETREVASAAGHGPVDAGLFAVVVHRGTNADSGHYYTYVKAAAPPTVMLQVPQNGGVGSPRHRRRPALLRERGVGTGWTILR